MAAAVSRHPGCTYALDTHHAHMLDLRQDSPPSTEESSTVVIGHRATAPPTSPAQVTQLLQVLLTIYLATGVAPSDDVACVALEACGRRRRLRTAVSTTSRDAKHKEHDADDDGCDHDPQPGNRRRQRPAAC